MRDSEMSSSENIEANLILVNSRIWTPGQIAPKLGAIAIGGGRILRVGTNAKCEAEASRKAKTIDVRRRLVIPGFIDSHAHLLHTGPRLDWLQLENVQSLKHLLKQVAIKVKSTKRGEWIFGRNFDESNWTVQRCPTRWDLDSVANYNPILLRRIDGHMAIVNTLALKKLRMPRNVVGLEKDESGRLTGVLRKDALEMAGKTTKPSENQLEAGFLRMQRMAHALGITSVHDIVDESCIKVYDRLYRKQALKLRINLLPLVKIYPSIAKKFSNNIFENPWLRIGPIKMFSDGSFGSRTAALYEPYADAAGEKGLLTYHKRELSELMQKINRKGFQLAIHAIGDRSIDTVVKAYEDVLNDHPRLNHRHRIEHFELPTDFAIKKCAELGLMPVMQPNFVVQWGDMGGMYESRLGKTRAKVSNPHKILLRHGLHVAFGSDGMPYGPIFGLKGAVHAPYPNQHIPLHKALEMYTLGGAYASFEENVKGRLSPGYYADIVVIDGIWGGKGDYLNRWRVCATIVDGEIVYKNPRIKFSS